MAVQSFADFYKLIPGLTCTSSTEETVHSTDTQLSVLALSTANVNAIKGRRH